MLNRDVEVVNEIERLKWAQFNKTIICYDALKQPFDSVLYAITLFQLYKNEFIQTYGSKMHLKLL